MSYPPDLTKVLSYQPERGELNLGVLECLGVQSQIWQHKEGGFPSLVAFFSFLASFYTQRAFVHQPVLPSSVCSGDLRLYSQSNAVLCRKFGDHGYLVHVIGARVQLNINWFCMLCQIKLLYSALSLELKNILHVHVPKFLVCRVIKLCQLVTKVFTSLYEDT